jgi:hypothetical protein
LKEILSQKNKKAIRQHVKFYSVKNLITLYGKRDKVLLNFVVHLRGFCELRGRHIEHFWFNVSSSYVSNACENLMRLFILIDSYVLNGPGIEFRLGRGFLCPSRMVLRPTKPPVGLQEVSPFFSGVKRSGRVADHQPPSTA